MASGMAKGSPDLKAHPEARSLDHTERPGLLLDQEVTVRRQSRQKRFLNRARATTPGARTICRRKIMTKHRVAKRAVRDVFASVLSDGVSAGQFRSVDPGTAAFALIGMCTKVGWRFTPERQADIDKVGRSIAELA